MLLHFPFRCLEQMGGSDWESNVSGMTGVVRFRARIPVLLNIFP